MTPTQFEQRIEDEASAWLARINIKEHVGKRHHIVPRTHLARFADDGGGIGVRDRPTGAFSARQIRDLSVRDFYTVLNTDGELDSSMETLLGRIEADAAAIFTRHVDLSAFRKSRPFTLEERLDLDMYVAFQFVRGMRTRRQYELLTDYYVKITHQHWLKPDQLENWEWAPHQNDHIASFHETARRVQANLMTRAACIATLALRRFSSVMSRSC